MTRNKLPIVMLGLLLPACNRYAFSVNQQEVFTPPPAFTDYELLDRALLTCVDQTITDGNISRPEQLQQLSCSYAGIRSLEGLEIFSGLERLNLAHNELTDLNALSAMPALEWVNLVGNPQLDCSALVGLNTRGVSVQAPEHCL